MTKNNIFCKISGQRLLATSILNFTQYNTVLFCIILVHTVCCQIHSYDHIFDILNNINKFDDIIMIYLSDCSVQIQPTSTVHAQCLLVF